MGSLRLGKPEQFSSWEFPWHFSDVWPRASCTLKKYIGQNQCHPSQGLLRFIVWFFGGCVGMKQFSATDGRPLRVTGRCQWVNAKQPHRMLWVNDTCSIYHTNFVSQLLSEWSINIRQHSLKLRPKSWPNISFSLLPQSNYISLKIIQGGFLVTS